MFYLALHSMTGHAQQAENFVSTVHCSFPAGLIREDLKGIDSEEIQMSSDKGEGRRGDRYSFSGNVRIVKKNQYIEADEATYNQSSRKLSATGNIHLQTNRLVIKGDKAEIDFSDDSGRITDSRYFFLDQGFRGMAQSFQYDDQRVVLSKATYSTCNQDSNQWQLKTGTLELDQGKNQGTATHVRLHVASVPVFYFPYLSFPLSGRKSGFLPPHLRTSNNNGADISVPYYLNLAPNLDATVVPRVIEKRGPQIAAEMRYLTQNHNGEFRAEYLANDKVKNESRSYYSLNENTQLGRHTQLKATFAEVSDVDYFRDLGTSLGTTSQIQLDRSIAINRAQENWSLSALVQDYQVLTPGAIEPYRRVPQIVASSLHTFYGMHFLLRGEVTRFDHDSLAGGDRGWLEPELTWLWQKPYAWFKPSLSLRSSFYQLENGNTTGSSTPGVMLDQGLAFDRPGKHWLATLEPRLHYLYIPTVDQYQLPLFDTGLTDPGIQQLFRKQRYSGADRMGDNNRLTLALTHRLIRGQTGQERLRATLAYAKHLSNQDIKLSNEDTYVAGDDLAAAQIDVALGAWSRLSGRVFHDQRYDRPDKGAIEWSREKGDDAVSLSYRYRRNSSEQIGIAGFLGLRHQWRLAGNWAYDLNTKQSPETALGIEYNGCCWKVRFLTRRYGLGTTGETDTSFGVQVEFKGLSTVGQRLDKEFSREILGYTPF